MYAILKNIHSWVTIDNLEDYLRPFLKGAFFQRDGQLKSIVIIQLNDKSGDAVERHALIRVCSDKARKRMIKSLNKQFFIDEGGQRQPVRAAEYVVRQIINDKRGNDFEKMMARGELRRGERRRLGLKVIRVAEKDFAVLERIRNR